MRLLLPLIFKLYTLLKRRFAYFKETSLGMFDEIKVGRLFKSFNYLGQKS